jgi:hypothetical protein
MFQSLIHSSVPKEAVSQAKAKPHAKPLR